MKRAILPDFVRMHAGEAMLHPVHCTCVQLSPTLGQTVTQHRPNRTGRDGDSCVTWSLRFYSPDLTHCMLPIELRWGGEPKLLSIQMLIQNLNVKIKRKASVQPYEASKKNIANGWIKINNNNTSIEYKIQKKLNQ